MFQQFRRDNLLLATLAYNVGPYRLLGSGKIPKSTLIRKLEARHIYREYIAFCNYKEETARYTVQTEKGRVCAVFIP
jgi:hypothetical protein